MKVETDSTFGSGQPIEAFDLFLLFSQLTANKYFTIYLHLGLQICCWRGEEGNLTKNPLRVLGISSAEGRI